MRLLASPRSPSSVSRACKSIKVGSVWIGNCQPCFTALSLLILKHLKCATHIFSYLGSLKIPRCASFGLPWNALIGMSLSCHTALCLLILRLLQIHHRHVFLLSIFKSLKRCHFNFGPPAELLACLSLWKSLKIKSAWIRFYHPCHTA